MNAKPVVIIGAGLAGLCCARQLARHGVDFLLLETQDDVGGRVRTDVVDGFLLDRGFQVLQTAYPEARQELDYPSLHLKNFEPGAMIMTSGKTVKMSDPWRRPFDLFSTTFNEIGDLSDRWKLARLRQHVTRSSLDQLAAEPDSTTIDYLSSECGFSPDMIDRFFRPWFAGVFFDSTLSTSSRFFKFLFRIFAIGETALPAEGMGKIPQQLAATIPAGQKRFNTRVESLDGLRVRLAEGESIDSRAIVLAVEGPEASRLTAGLIETPDSCGTICFYYAAPQPPLTEKLLVLNADASGPINNLCVPSNVAAGYAPAGNALISVSVVGSQEHWPTSVADDVLRQLRRWYGAQVDKWSLLRQYNLRHALPGQPTAFRNAPPPLPRVAQGLYRCGDYCESASIHGAMLSGRRAAECLMSDLNIPHSVPAQQRSA